jgi:predicted Zn-dependent peptidase
MEHKMFDNGEGETVDDIFSRLGADPNAFTSWEKTGYVVSANSGENFYKSLAELIRFVTTPYFTDESVAKEQGIIGQEIAMCEDDPYDRCFYGMVKGLYENNPVRIEIVGSESSIAKITPQMLYECHRRFYALSNMALVISGDVTAERALEVVDELISSAAPNPPVSRCYPTDGAGSYKKLIESKMTVERSLFSIGFKDSSAPDDPIERRKRQIIAEILTGVIFSSSNSLYTSLFKNSIMTTPFSYGEEYGKTYAFCYASGECDDPQKVLSEVTKYIEKLKKEGINESDFERRKKIIYASDIKMYDSTWDIASALFDNAFTGVDIFEESAIAKSITLDQANDVLCEIFTENNMTCSVIKPND